MEEKQKKKSKKSNIAIFIATLLGAVIAIIACGYFLLDRVVIPKKFGQYGINNLSDLTNVLSSLYSVPKESKLIENGYNDDDLKSGINKLQTANYKIESDGTILNENISSFKGNGSLSLTDREFAAICNKLLKSELLSENLPNLNYINTMNISIVDLVMKIDEDSLDIENNLYSKAKIKLIIKIDTTDLCRQIAIQMQTTEALLKIIIPSTLYFTVDYDIDLTKENENRTTGTIAINGKTEKQSEVLINLLIEFIFPNEDQMTYDKFTKAIGDVALSGIDQLGSFNFSINIDNTNQSGIIVK